MKKIVSFLMGVVVLTTASFAQPKMQPKKAEKAPVVKMAPATKMEATKPAKVVKMAPKAESAAQGVPLKKDGTPDKRFKAGKATDSPLKKDGTKDMRFKKNQPAAKKAA